MYLVINMAKVNTFFNMDMVVLSVLKTKDCYGYEIVKMIKDISHEALDVKQGTLYPIVHNLLEKGLISSRDEIFNKKIRVYYHIEPEGLEYLENTVKEFKVRIQGVFDIIAYGENGIEDEQ